MRRRATTVTVLLSVCFSSCLDFWTALEDCRGAGRCEASKGADGGNANTGADGGNANTGADGGNANTGADGGNANTGADGGNANSTGGTGPSTEDKTAPKAPTGVSCATQADGGVRLSWAAVTQDVNGGTENLKGYYTYYGATSHGAATSPSAFSYDHQSPASGSAPLSATSSVFPGLSSTQQTYFSVVAQDKSNNTSAFSQEVQCSAAFSGNSPPDVSGATATPLAGDAPLKVTFSADGVTDPDDNTMGFSWSFGDGTLDVKTRATTHDYTKAGVYAARLSVTDDGKPALASPATQDFVITVHTKDAGAD